MRMLGIDYGDVRVGFAACDENESLATGLRTEKVKGMRGAAKIAAEIAAAEQAGKIIVGMPLNMDGTRGFRAEKTLAFIELLKEYTDLPIEAFDERCTTVSAYGFLRESGVKKKKKRSIIDTLSAEILLQGYLDQKS